MSYTKFHFLAFFILLHSLPSHQQPNIISASPALLPGPSYTELSPDIAPLLPSPGGPAQSSMPTIPSSRSPPNPDATTSVWPDSALAPTGALQESPAASHVQVKGLVVRVEALSGFLAYGLLVFFMI